MEVDTCVQNEDVKISDCNKSEMDDYHDTDKIVPPKTLDDLIKELHKVFASDKVNIEYVSALMNMYKSNPKEWKKFAKFDPHRYTRNLVDEGNGKFNLMILCWNTAQASSIHDHANSHCFLKVMEGHLNEELFDWPENEEIQEMKPIKKTRLDLNEVGYMSDKLGIHRIENPSHTDNAVSLHLYCPPFDECQSFDQFTGHKRNAAITFWSKFGKRTPFGKEQSKQK
ncbi:cysteine dioxygenase type 1-like [Mytilus californianus]|uniref:cysteine dioxygenase type 1-like n=1 Tax=Mytilus californianus TaxID=6549 RepID=UPI00224791BC|nr:cysteine dioxygenase type 1-like [Mytilus californianus]